MGQNYFLPQRWRNAFPSTQRLVWRLEYSVIAALFTIFRLLPLVWATRFGGALFAFFGPRIARAEKVRKNLRVVFPQKNCRQIGTLTRGVFRHFGTAMVELVCLDQINRERESRVEFCLKPGAAKPSNEQRSVFITAHCGAWELAPLIAPHYGFTMPIIYAPEENPFVERKLATLRRAYGSPVVSRDGGVRVFMRALDKGESIGLLVDNRMDEGESLPFFGEEALTNTVPARLALRYDCPLVPILAERLPGARFRVHVYPPIRPRDDMVSANEQARNMSLQTNLLFEAWIREKPSQWLCIKRRWPKAVYEAVSRARTAHQAHL